jgi:hypothetical protein
MVKLSAENLRLFSMQIEIARAWCQINLGVKGTSHTHEDRDRGEQPIPNFRGFCE